MDIADFQDLLDRLGDDLATWPAPQQESAVILLRSSDEAHLALEQSRLLRRALSTTPIRARAELTDRIMQGAGQAVAEPAAIPLPACTRPE
jgi:hypothetical protein